MNLDDPVLDLYRSYLQAIAVAGEAASAERQARANLIELVRRSEWLEPETLWFLYWQTSIPVESFAHHLAVPVIQVGALLQPGLERECGCCHESAPMPNRQAIKARHFECGPCETHRREAIALRSLGYERERARWAARVRELEAMPYKEYLLSPEWQERRQVAHKRAGYRCQVCSTKARILDVHHNTYDNRGNEDPKDLVVLCRPCHARYHGKPE